VPRPKRCRKVCCDPEHRYFKPRGIPLSKLKKKDLGLDELESLRLADLEGMSQTEAAQSMGISQPTFNRILASAREKVAECIVNGSALRIGTANDPDIDIQPTAGKTNGHCRREARGRGGCRGHRQ
jgi:predicted DNA-binding protein (UPF0251 family)